MPYSAHQRRHLLPGWAGGYIQALPTFGKLLRDGEPTENWTPPGRLCLSRLLFGSLENKTIKNQSYDVIILLLRKEHTDTSAGYLTSQ